MASPFWGDAAELLWDLDGRRSTRQGLLRKLLSFNSICAHLRIHEEHKPNSDDMSLQSERSYIGSTPRIVGESEDAKVGSPSPRSV